MLFRKLGIVTIVTVYLLVLAGGIVRSTGSGMGCPDWPKCFGRFIPPTELSQLPTNYQEIYAEKLHGEVIFNATKTWIEYVNRLLGAFTGILVLATFVVSIYYYFKNDRLIVYLSFLSLLLIGANGFLGKYVVDTFLKPGIVTLHMLLAVLVIFVLLYAIARAWSEVIYNEQIQNRSTLNKVIIVTIILSTLQVLLGTQVREAIDKVVANPVFGYNRNVWIEQMGLPFFIHRTYSLVILGFHIYLIRLIKKNIESKGLVYKFMISLLVIVIIEIATGIVMAYFGVPAYIQPIHLTLSVISLGIQFIIFLLLNSERVFGKNNHFINQELNTL